jgi:transcription initiation factor IIE alpha subunit
MFENFDHAPIAREQTLVVWGEKGPKLIGPKPSEDTWELLRYVLKHGDVTSAEAAKVLGKQVNNVSTRLKRMTSEGLVLRKDVNAASGGIEYRYISIC